MRKFVRGSQGSDDPHSPWARARCNWGGSQLLIRFGLMASKMDSEGNIQDWFNAEKMAKLEKCQAAWWDEMRSKCVIGGQAAGNGSCHACDLKGMRVNGKLDPKHGSCNDQDIVEVRAKFKKEIRLCLGCAGTAAACNHSGETISSVKDWEEWKVTEIAGVKSLKSSGSKCWGH